MRALESFRRYAKAASNNFNTGVAKQFSAQWIVLAVLNKFQGAFIKNSAAGMFGKQAASTSIASPMKDLKIKGGSFDMAEQQVLQVLL
jgi:hypothetical protein